MKRGLVYPLLIGSAITTIFLAPTIAYGGERINRFKQQIRQIYNQATKLDRSSSRENNERAKDIAGKILGPGARQVIERMDMLNQSDTGYQERLRISREIIKQRSR